MRIYVWESDAFWSCVMTFVLAVLLSGVDRWRQTHAALHFARNLYFTSSGLLRFALIWYCQVKETIDMIHDYFEVLSFQMIAIC